MDLAQIRKKYRRLSEEVPDIHVRNGFKTVEPSVQSTSMGMEASVDPVVDFFHHSIPLNAAQVSVAALSPERPTEYRDPIEIIMAGRRAAGCDQENSDDQELSRSISVDCSEYLCFRVFDEFYGINIMDIKEIIRPREVTEIPSAPKFLSGIVSLRGVIIPIIDMRARLGLTSENMTGKERVVVIKNAQSFSGLLVDEVIQFVSLDRESLEPAPYVLEGIDRDFVAGIGRSEGRLIIILNLESIADINLL